ncbi:MAG: thiamine diphosphokinase [Clostridia bacterium]|nr:thiamine diphosphokinase [Clostridia bacterium]
MKTCYIVGAGEYFEPFLKEENDFVIAADGGYTYLKEAGIRPDLCVGDFDSFGGNPVGNTLDGIPVERHPTRKDDSDLSLAFRSGFARGYRRFVFLGATGGRADHTVANLQLLSFVRDQGADAVLRFPKQDAFLVRNESRTVTGRVGAYLSVFAFGGKAEGVTYSGLSYPLDGATLTPDFPLGLSNAFAEPTAVISVSQGTLLVFAER